jgi:hypothetical protein
VTTLAVHTVHDPALFIWVFLEKVSSSAGIDRRTEILKQLDAFAARFHLEPCPRGRPFRCAGDINLVDLSSSPFNFEALVELESERPKSPTGTYYQCLVYTYGDALILQFIITKFSDWKGTFIVGWDELIQLLHNGFDAKALYTGATHTLGVTALYWAISDPAVEIDSYETDVRLIGEG